MYNGENWIHRNYTSFCSNRLWWNDEFRTEIRSARFQSNTNCYALLSALIVTSYAKRGTCEYLWRFQRNKKLNMARINDGN